MPFKKNMVYSSKKMPNVNIALNFIEVFCLCRRSASTTPSGSPCSSQQSVYQPGGTSGPSVGVPASWNPFGDDNFSKLTAEELLNKDFAKLDGKINAFISRQVFQVNKYCTVFVVVF